eukprot:439629-Prorocentrum_minimum.AAC.1
MRRYNRGRVLCFVASKFDRLRPSREVSVERRQSSGQGGGTAAQGVQYVKGATDLSRCAGYQRQRVPGSTVQEFQELGSVRRDARSGAQVRYRSGPARDAGVLCDC